MRLAHKSALIVGGNRGIGLAVWFIAGTIGVYTLTSGRRVMAIELSTTAPTEFVEANGIKYAYRRLGQSAGVPLVFLQHFTGTMDSWDPTVVDGFAKARPVILFDNAGVSRSSGGTPDNVPAMAKHAVAFI